MIKEHFDKAKFLECQAFCDLEVEWVIPIIYPNMNCSHAFKTFAAIQRCEEVLTLGSRNRTLKICMLGMFVKDPYFKAPTKCNWFFEIILIEFKTRKKTFDFLKRSYIMNLVGRTFLNWLCNCEKPCHHESFQNTSEWWQYFPQKQNKIYQKLIQVKTCRLC